ncbi:MAG: helix-turn-helix domain-containing protein [Clostridia bacterium]|nr:helix-turn-helix domain-containing protein [Clostridia bacterium]
MIKEDITSGGLYISKLINVIRSGNKNHHKLLKVNCRHSDAFVYVISGSCSYEFDDGTAFSVGQGYLIYLPHNARYTMFIHDENYRFIFCDFRFDSPNPRKSFALPPKNGPHMENLFIKLLNMYSSPSPSSRADAMAALYSIYAAIITMKNETYIAGTLKEKMSRVKEYIDLHFNDASLSIAALAGMAGISEVYFRRIFAAQHGCPPSQYLLSVRLKNAKTYLSYPFLAVEECAAKSGFSSAQYFCRVFKKELGVTPSEYRKRI